MYFQERKKIKCAYINLIWLINLTVQRQSEQLEKNSFNIEMTTHWIDPDKHS